jgi:hypothetical protein
MCGCGYTTEADETTRLLPVEPSNYPGAKNKKSKKWQPEQRIFLVLFSNP